MPLTSKTFSQLIDFTRTSAATYVDQLGRIVPTPVSPNILTFTQEFDNAAWSKSSGLVTVTANAALAPDGTMTADRFVSTGGAYPQAGQTTTVVAGSSYIASVWVKSDGTPQVAQALIFDGATTAFTPGPEWQRVSVLLPSSTGGSKVVVIATNSASAPASSFLIWGAQLEQTPDANLTLGSELTTNGTLDTDTAWAKGTGWTISSGAAQGNVGAFQVIDQTITITTGKVYRVSFDVTAYSSGNVRASLIGGTAVIGAVRASTGQYVAYLAAVSGNNKIAIGSDGSGFVGTVDNISVREVTAASPSTYTRNFGGRFPPRFDYDPVTLAPRGLLIEEQRTNLLVRSEELDNATWQKTTGGVASTPVVTSNFGTSPDGTIDADRVQFALNGGTATADRSLIAQSVTIVNATSYTFSIWLRSLGASVSMGIGMDGVAGNTPITVTSTWQRFTLTGTSSGTSGLAWLQLRGGQTPAQANSADILVWGAQLEAGAFATSYIPTVASQVTRTADSAAITGANFSPWYNQSEGTFLVDYDQIAATASQIKALVITNDGTSNNRVYGYVGNTGVPALLVSSGGVVQANPSSPAVVSSGPAIKTAIAYKPDDFAIVTGGGSAVTDTSGASPANANRLEIASFGAGAQLNGHIRSIRYYPTRLTNAQLQALTA